MTLRPARGLTPVPAVSRSVRILAVLADTPAGATLSEVAGRTALSKSTASNLLRTMVAEGLLEHDSDTRRFLLGPLLLQLGAAAIGRALPFAETKQHMARLAEMTKLACLAIQRMPDGHFVALEKIESRKDIKVTINVGERFPAEAPLLSRLWNAWSSAPIVAARAGAGARVAEEAVRRQGYATVAGEYIPNLNVVGFAVFGSDAEPRLLIALLGIGLELSPEEIVALAPELVATARELTLSTGGRLPTAFPD
jgi:DNA-binding IclR family transcriptional regulator